MTDRYDEVTNRTRVLCEARGDTIAGLRETLRLVMIVMALRDHTPFARPMGEAGRPIEGNPYVPRPTRPMIPRPRPAPSAETRRPPDSPHNRSSP